MPGPYAIDRGLARSATPPARKKLPQFGTVRRYELKYKTSLGNLWYRRNITEAEVRLDQYCRQHNDVAPIVMRGDR